MKSPQRGKSTLPAEVLNISANGVWILVLGTEYFLSSAEFPWFGNATVSQISDLRLSHGKHLRWPQLDVELELESLEHLDQYPLVYR